MRKSRHGFFSLSVLFVITLVPFAIPGLTSANVKDCVSVESDLPATVHQGRYNILCARLVAGAFHIACRADGVVGESTLRVGSVNVQPAIERVIQLRGNGELLSYSAVAGPNAHVFFSYDGPFNPIRDGYRLTCSW